MPAEDAGPATTLGFSGAARGDGGATETGAGAGVGRAVATDASEAGVSIAFGKRLGAGAAGDGRSGRAAGAAVMGTDATAAIAGAAIATWWV